MAISKATHSPIGPFLALRPRLTVGNMTPDSLAGDRLGLHPRDLQIYGSSAILLPSRSLSALTLIISTAYLWLLHIAVGGKTQCGYSNAACQKPARACRLGGAGHSGLHAHRGLVALRRRLHGRRHLHDRGLRRGTPPLPERTPPYDVHDGGRRRGDALHPDERGPYGSGAGGASKAWSGGR